MNSVLLWSIFSFRTGFGLAWRRRRTPPFSGPDGHGCLHPVHVRGHHADAGGRVAAVGDELRGLDDVQMQQVEAGRSEQPHAQLQPVLGVAPRSRRLGWLRPSPAAAARPTPTPPSPASALLSDPHQLRRRVAPHSRRLGRLRPASAAAPRPDPTVSRVRVPPRPSPVPMWRHAALPPAWTAAPGGGGGGAPRSDPAVSCVRVPPRPSPAPAAGSIGVQREEEGRRGELSTCVGPGSRGEECYRLSLGLATISISHSSS